MQTKLRQTESHPAETAGRGQRLQSLLAGLLTLASAAALHATASVTMPVAFALFLVVLFGPLLGLLCKHLPRALAVALTFLAMLATLGGLAGAVGACAKRVSEALPSYRQTLSDLMSHALGALRAAGLSASRSDSTEQLLDNLGSSAAAIADGLTGATGGLVLVVTFAALALAETDNWREKLRRQYGDGSLRTAREIGSRCRQYVFTRTATSALTGLLTGLLAWAVGVDLAFVWAMLAFLLNYIPTLGGIIAIIPPTLLAAAQLGGLGAFGFFIGLTLIQLIIGSFLDPKLQGRSLQLSPFVVMSSIGVWGWIWGVGGALLGVPLTVCALVICDQFPRSRWIADMLASGSGGSGPSDGSG